MQVTGVAIPNFCIKSDHLKDLISPPSASGNKSHDPYIPVRFKGCMAPELGCPENQIR